MKSWSTRRASFNAISYHFQRRCMDLAPRQQTPTVKLQLRSAECKNRSTASNSVSLSASKLHRRQNRLELTHSTTCRLIRMPIRSLSPHSESIHNEVLLKAASYIAATSSDASGRVAASGWDKGFPMVSRHVVGFVAISILKVIRVLDLWLCVQCFTYRICSQIKRPDFL